MRAVHLLFAALLVLLLLAQSPTGAEAKKKKKKAKKKKKPLQIAPRKSRFGNRMDAATLDRLWEDEEEDDWHEDSWEWKKKKTAVEYKEIFNAAAEMPQPNTPGFNADDWIEAAELQKTRGYVEYRVKVETRSHRDTVDLSRLYVDGLRTNGVQTGSLVEDADTILFTQEDGRFKEFRDFIMSQPPVLSLTFGEEIYYPEGKAPPEPPKRPNAALDPNWKPPISLADLPPRPAHLDDEL